MTIHDLRTIYKAAVNNQDDPSYRILPGENISNLEQTKKIILFGLISGHFGNGEVLFLQKDAVKKLGVNRGTLLQAYDSIRKDFEEIKAKNKEAVFPITDEYKADYEFSMSIYELFNGFYNELEAGLDNLVENAIAIRYPKHKLVTKFIKKFDAKYYNFRITEILARYNYRFQENKINYLPKLKKVLESIKKDYNPGSALICDGFLPCPSPFDNTVFFDEKNGFSFDFFSFDKAGAKPKLIFDLIFCPEHSFSSLYSPSNIFSFLLRAKNQIKSGILVLNLYNYSNKLIEQDKKSCAVYEDMWLDFVAERTYLQRLFDIKDVDASYVLSAKLSKYSHVIYENADNAAFEKELGVHFPQPHKKRQIMSTLTDLKYELALEFDDIIRYYTYRDLKELIAYSPYAMLKILRHCGLVCEIKDENFRTLLSDRPELAESCDDIVLDAALALGIDDCEALDDIKEKNKYLDFYYVCRIK